jgi:hypothetical protein
MRNTTKQKVDRIKINWYITHRKIVDYACLKERLIHFKNNLSCEDSHGSDLQRLIMDYYYINYTVVIPLWNSQFANISEYIEHLICKIDNLQLQLKKDVLNNML